MEIDHSNLPEPLQRFDQLAAPLSSLLKTLDVLADRYRGRRADASILPSTLEAVRVEMTYHSNAIEGSSLTLRETQLIIEGHSPAGEKDLREVYEARNHDRALRLIEQWAATRPTEALTERDLLDVQAHVLADIDRTGAGRFRSDRVRIVGKGFVPPGPNKFDVLIPQLISEANRDGVHAVLQAAELHYNLVAVHPFTDGNGRTGRLMMNHHLLRHDYPYAMIEVNRRGEYLTALDEANHGRTQPFAEFIAESILRTGDKLLL